MGDETRSPPGWCGYCGSIWSDRDTEPREHHEACPVALRAGLNLVSDALCDAGTVVVGTTGAEYAEAIRALARDARDAWGRAAQEQVIALEAQRRAAEAERQAARIFDVLTAKEARVDELERALSLLWEEATDPVRGSTVLSAPCAAVVRALLADGAATPSAPEQGGRAHTCACGAADEASGSRWPIDTAGGYLHHPDGCTAARPSPSGGTDAR